MGPRTGQIDPGVLLYLLQDKGLSPEELGQMLYHQSGLKGLSGISHDMRVLEASDAPEAAQAIDYFVFRIRRELGAMAAILGGIDALVFCGGIGENAHHIRERVASGFEWLGIELDHHRNRISETVISSDRSRCGVFVIKTNEERMIAEHTLSLLRSQARSDQGLVLRELAPGVTVEAIRAATGEARAIGSYQDRGFGACGTRDHV